MAESTTSGDRPIKLGVIADQTGPLSFVGLANANVAKMVIDDINANGLSTAPQGDMAIRVGEFDSEVIDGGGECHERVSPR